jgi:hypothetical protein
VNIAADLLQFRMELDDRVNQLHDDLGFVGSVLFSDCCFAT